MYKKIVGSITLGMLISSLAACNSEGEPKVETTSSNTCALDVINGERGALVRLKSGVVDFRGWAADFANSTAPATLQLVFKDNEGRSYPFESSLRYERPDVVKAYKQDAFLKSGFSVKADISSLKPGAYGVVVKMIDGNRVVVCPIKKNIIVE